MIPKEFYNTSLATIKETIESINKNPNDAIEIVYSLKNKEFNTKLREKCNATI